ncbi:MAG: leucine-rich repeat domain-containing protein [Verrucomicrobiota bacterium]|nr:leucine-rich repeat domain-containing protein [Verrucomicrobiota bacterium]
MKSLLLVLGVVLVGCGGGKQEGTQRPSSPEPATPPQAPLPTEPQPEPKETAEKPKPPKVVPNSPEATAAVRRTAGKLTGDLTKADFERVTSLDLGYARLTSVQGLEKLTQLKVLSLGNNQLTDVKGLEKLTQLKALYLSKNPNLTKAQIAALQKALPNCKFLELR